MKKNFFIITAVVCGMSCTTTAYAQFKIGGKKINVGKVVQAADKARYGLRQASGEADRKYQGSGRLEGELRCL